MTSRVGVTKEAVSHRPDILTIVFNQNIKYTVIINTYIFFVESEK